MDITDYKFKVGDEVITTSGRIGKIVHICDCKECKNRGFYEPVWSEDHAIYQDYITNIDAEHGFPTFYKIGEYRFREFDRDGIHTELLYHEREIAKLNEQLRIMDRLEKED